MVCVEPQVSLARFACLIDIANGQVKEDQVTIEMFQTFSNHSI